MAKVSLNTIKNWFKTGLKPTQQQFWDTWDSFRHKDEPVLPTEVDGLGALLGAKAENAVMQNHINSEDAHGMGTVISTLNSLSGVVDDHTNQLSALDAEQDNLRQYAEGLQDDIENIQLIPGPQGEQGIQGEKGDTGDKGDTGAIPDTSSFAKKNEANYFTSPYGSSFEKRLQINTTGENYDDEGLIVGAFYGDANQLFVNIKELGIKFGISNDRTVDIFPDFDGNAQNTYLLWPRQSGQLSVGMKVIKATAVGDGLTAIFHIPHGLDQKPDYVMFSPNSVGAASMDTHGEYTTGAGVSSSPEILRAPACYITANSTHVTIWYNKGNYDSIASYYAPELNLPLAWTILVGTAGEIIDLNEGE